MHAARRMTLMTRSIWVLGHSLIGAAILMSPSKFRAAVEERQVVPLVVAIVLAAVNVALYIAVTVTDPGRVRANSCPTPSIAMGISSPVSSIGGASERTGGGGGLGSPPPPSDPLAGGPSPAAGVVGGFGGTAVGLSRWGSGFKRVSATDDGEDEAFHDGALQLSSVCPPDGGSGSSVEVPLQYPVRCLCIATCDWAICSRSWFAKTEGAI